MNSSVSNVMMTIENLDSPNLTKLIQPVKVRHSLNPRYPLTHKGEICCVKLCEARDVITDPHRGFLIADCNHNQVLLLRKTGNVVKILDQHVRSPGTL